MLMIEVTPEPPIVERIAPFQSSVSGMVGIAGAYKGILVIHAPDVVAMNLTSIFLGMDVAEVDDDVRDAMGELANMLGGSIKQVISPGGKDVSLSIPSAVCGKEYFFELQSKNGRGLIPFTFDGGKFLIEWQIQEQ